MSNREVPTGSFQWRRQDKGRHTCGYKRRPDASTVPGTAQNPHIQILPGLGADLPPPFTQFKSNCFSVTANIASRSVSHWLSYQDQSFPDSFSFLTYALTWFGSSLMVPEIMKSKIKQMKKLLLTSNQCCYSPGQGPLIFPEVSLCSDWPSAFQKS